MRRAVAAVVVACVALAVGAGFGVREVGRWVLGTQDDREVAW